MKDTKEVIRQMEELIKFKEELVAEKEKLIAEKADKMEILDVMRDIEKTIWCGDFVAKYGWEIRIPCGKDFTLIIDPWLRRKEVGIYGTFVLNAGMEDFMYNHVYDSHSDLGEWFDEMCQNLFFGIQDAPVLTQNISDIDGTVKFYKGEKAQKVYEMISAYLKFIVEANPLSVDDYDYY